MSLYDCLRQSVCDCLSFSPASYYLKTPLISVLCLVRQDVAVMAFNWPVRSLCLPATISGIPRSSQHVLAASFAVLVHVLCDLHQTFLSDFSIRLFYQIFLSDFSIRLFYQTFLSDFSIRFFYQSFLSDFSIRLFYKCYQLSCMPLDYFCKVS